MEREFSGRYGIHGHLMVTAGGWLSWRVILQALLLFPSYGDSRGWIVERGRGEGEREKKRERWEPGEVDRERERGKRARERESVSQICVLSLCVDCQE